jgi:hypothetical protein
MHRNVPGGGDSSRPPWSRPPALVPVAASPPTGSAQADAVPASFSFAGSGFGHGVGLSQYGARGMALEGATAAADRRALLHRSQVAPVTDSMNLRVNLLHRRPARGLPTEALAGGRGHRVTVTGRAPVLGAGRHLDRRRRHRRHHAAAHRAGVTTTIGTGTYVVVRWAGTRNQARPAPAPRCST